MGVSLPERTVDAWVAAYLQRRVPRILMWSPTQRHVPDYDLAAELPRSGQLFIFENKAPHTNGNHHFAIPLRQMWNYLRDARLRKHTFYLLPCPPYSTADVRNSSRPAGRTLPPLIPGLASARLSGHTYRGSQGFESWCRVISVSNLWQHCVGTPTPRVGAGAWIKNQWSPDRQFKPNAVRRVNCQICSEIGESLKSFADSVVDPKTQSALRITPDSGSFGYGFVASDNAHPFHNALVNFVPDLDVVGGD